MSISTALVTVGSNPETETEMDYSPFPNGRPQWLQTQLQDQPLNQDEMSSQQRNEGTGEVMLGANEDVSGERVFESVLRGQRE